MNTKEICEKLDKIAEGLRDMLDESYENYTNWNDFDHDILTAADELDEIIEKLKYGDFDCVVIDNNPMIENIKRWMNFNKEDK